jgi:hypothetical protein
MPLQIRETTWCLVAEAHVVAGPAEAGRGQRPGYSNYRKFVRLTGRPGEQPRPGYGSRH